MEIGEAMRVLADVYDDLEDEGVEIRATRDAAASVNGEVVRATVEIEVPFRAEAETVETIAPQSDPKPHRPHRDPSQFPAAEQPASPVYEQIAGAIQTSTEGSSGQEEPEPDTQDEPRPDDEEDNDEQPECAEELAKRTVGQQLYVGSRATQRLGDPDYISCVRDGDGTRLLVAGDRDGWPAYKVTGNVCKVATKGLDAFDISRGDEVQFLNRDDDGIVVEVVEWGVEPNLEAIPDDPDAVLDGYASELSMDEVIAAAAQYEDPIQIHQRLGGNSPSNGATTKELLVDLGLRTRAGEVPDDIDNRVAAIQEVSADA